MATKRHVKVIKFEILKPTGDMSWDDLAQLFRDVRYRVFRLGNLSMSEYYLAFHLYRTGRTDEWEMQTIGRLNKYLRGLLQTEYAARKQKREEEQKKEERKKKGKKGKKKEPKKEQREEPDPELLSCRLSRDGALPASVCDALSSYRIRALTASAKWSTVTSGHASLPTFRGNMAIPVRCDKAGQRRLEETPEGDVEVDLMLCIRPYPRVMLKTGKLTGRDRATLDRFLENPKQSSDGYRQRCFEIKQDSQKGSRWHLYVTYDFPAAPPARLSKERIVGINLGFTCPLYVAINNGDARLGWKHFVGLGERVKNLRVQTVARRRNMLRGGKSSLSAETARAGHGRRRKLQSTEKLRGRIDNAYTTLNHQFSKAVIDFAVNHGAGVIQIEDLSGLQGKLTGTFLGEQWRYHQLQSFIEYKAKEVGITVRRLNPRYTSRRCSECGYIHEGFDSKFRMANRREGFVTRFECPKCKHKGDPDYNAACNLATLDIEKLIERQCKRQGIKLVDS